jgi:hypothetical protein
MTVTAVLSCGHLKEVPEGIALPDVAECPVSGQEREIRALWDDEE